MAITTDTDATFIVSFVDKKGRPATFATPPVITLDRTDLGTLTINADGYSGTIVPVGPLGTGTITAVGTRMDGSTVAATAVIEFIAAEPVSGTITVTETV